MLKYNMLSENIVYIRSLPMNKYQHHNNLQYVWTNREIKKVGKWVPSYCKIGVQWLTVIDELI